MRNRPIDIRDARLSGGRLTISSRTSDPIEYELRKRAILTLLDEGDRGAQVIEALRARRLRIEHVTEMVRQRRIGELLTEAREEAPEPDAIMLGATIDRFLDRVRTHSAKETARVYEGLCATMEEAFGVERDRARKVVRDIPLIDIGMEEGEAWLHGPKRKGRPWSASRQSVAHNVAHQVWALGIELDEERSERTGAPRTITRNPWSAGRARIRPPKVQKTRKIFLSRSQAGRLLWATRGRPAAAVMALGLYAGLRAGEIANLRTSHDVRLLERELSIQSRGGKYRWRPKTSRSQRTVPISTPLGRWLRAHVRHGYAGDTYFVRATKRDSPLSHSTMIGWAKDAYATAGIKYGRDKGGATLHTLRHTFASWLASKDLQLMKIAALMGDTVQEVEKTYAHLLPSDLVSAVELMRHK